MLAIQQPGSCLPQISPSRVAFKLGCGALVWMGIRSIVLYGTRGLFRAHIMQDKNEPNTSIKNGLIYTSSTMMEYGVSCLCYPTTFLAGITAPRYLLDYMFTSFSEYICFFDRFNPGEYAAFSLYAFENGPNEDWNFAFFSWQMPSVFLTILKLIYRRRKLGAKHTRTRRVLSVLGMQVLIRAFLCSFSVFLPDSSASALQSIVACILDSVTTRYLIWKTNPFENELGDNVQ